MIWEGFTYHYFHAGFRFLPNASDPSNMPSPSALGKIDILRSSLKFQKRNGLSYWDETLLKYTAKHGPRTAKIIGYTLTDCMKGLDLVGDLYLFSRLKNLGRPNLSGPFHKYDDISVT